MVASDPIIEFMDNPGRLCITDQRVDGSNTQYSEVRGATQYSFDGDHKVLVVGLESLYLTQAARRFLRAVLSNFDDE